MDTTIRSRLTGAIVAALLFIVAEAVYDTHTQFPADFDPQAAGMRQER